MARKIFMDFETQSACDLKKAGAAEYARDKSTRALCLAFKEGKSAKTYLLDFYFMQKKWCDLPERFKKLWQSYVDGDYNFHAHNNFFENCVYHFVLVDRLGWPPISQNRMRCTAVKAAAAALPRNLADAGAVARIAIQKDYEGHRVMLKLCKPTAAWAKWNKARIQVESGVRLGHKIREIASRPEPPKFWTPETAPDDFKILYRYCKIDVLAEEKLDEFLPELTPFEQRLWFIDQKINMRGIAVDVPLVKKISKIMAAESKTMTKELDILTMGLVSSGNARNAILDFLTLEGIELPNLRAKTVDDFLENGKVTGDAEKILKIRRALSKSSTAKYLSFLARSASDGRVRDLLLFYGAQRTGRWGGKGVQPQNFPRGVLKDIYEAIDRIKNCSLEELKFLYGENLMPLFSSVLRGMFIASPGHDMFVEDYSAIECRVLWFLAGHEKGLQMFRDNRDPYVEMAAKIYNKSILEIDKESNERQVGKAAVLGCFEENTKVLTDSGWKKITDVLITDKVWDGVEWVNHSGLIYQGKKEVVEFQGVKLTPDHLLLFDRGWVCANAARKESAESLKSALDLVNLPSSVILPESVAGFWPCKLSAIAAQIRTKYFCTIFLRAVRHAVMLAQKKQQSIGKRNTILMPRLCRTINTANDFLIGLVRQLQDAIQKIPQVLSITAPAAFGFAPNGAKIAAPFLLTFKPLKIGISPNLRSIGLTTIRVINPVTFDLFLGRTIQKIKDRLSILRFWLQSLKPKTHVYDIALSGPRNRFTILTDAGPIIAHNCGYQMGGKKFVSSAWDVYRAKADTEMAKVAVSVYREVHYPVVEMWEQYQKAVCHAVRKPGQVFRVGKVKFYRDRRWLFIELPSGRRLSYCDPEIRIEPTYKLMKGDEITYASTESLLKTALEEGFQIESKFDTERFAYWEVNQLARKEDCVIPKWTRERTYGGKLVENVVQAVSRDLLAEATVRAENAGFKVLMHAHDELVCEAPKGKFKSEDFRKIMEELPAWADGLPIKSGGWSGPRYQKK